MVKPLVAVNPDVKGTKKEKMKDINSITIGGKECLNIYDNQGSLSVPPVYHNVSVGTSPTALLSGTLIKECTIRNASLIDVILCAEDGTSGLTLEPGMSKAYKFNAIVQLYAKVGSGTAIVEIEERT
ncbi:MAG: hypothetical protein K8E24_003185 [Methanobacterium paludis]|nr:hypothetical protein [Methanobacterium paludis]